MAFCDHSAVVWLAVLLFAQTGFSQTCDVACKGDQLWSFFPVPSGFGVTICRAANASAQPIDSIAIGCSLAPASIFLYLADSSTMVMSSPYSSVSSSGAYGLIRTSTGLVFNVSDVYSALDDVFEGDIRISRSVHIVAGGVDNVSSAIAGFASRVSFSLLADLPVEQWRLFMPGVFYNDGGAAQGWTPTHAIAGNLATGSSFLAREDRLAAPFVFMQDATTGHLVWLARPRESIPNTVLAETLQGTPLVDSRLAFSSLGLERTAGDGAQVTVLFPGSEYDITYQSGAPSGRLLRFHPATLDFSHTFEILIGGASFTGPDPDARFAAAMTETWQAAVDYFQPPLRSAINLTRAYEALVASLADSAVPATPGNAIPGVPTGFDKMTGVAYSSVLELGFVGPQLRMAVAVLHAAIRADNASRATLAASWLDAWVATTGPGFGHAVWDMGYVPRDVPPFNTTAQSRPPHTRRDTSQPVAARSTATVEERSGHSRGASPATSAGIGRWIDDGVSSDGHLLVYLRRAVVSHLHALEAADLADSVSPQAAVYSAIRGKAVTWRAWGLSLAPVLQALQAADGSFARQYAVHPGTLPVASQASTTASALPIHYLVTASLATSNKSATLAWQTSARAAGEFAWNLLGRRSLYVGAAIDNPDVVDKESALFAADGFLALHDVTSGAEKAAWLDRAAAAATVASTWVQITSIPNPLDAPAAWDFAPQDTSAGTGLIAVGHSGSDTFGSMFVWPLFRLCALTGDTHHAVFARLALFNTKQMLDLDGTRGYAMPGYMSELWSFSVGWDIFSGHNDGRGVGDVHWVPWTSANGAYGIAQLCWAGNGTRGLPQQCAVSEPLPC